jgi:hypothetical protein
MGTLSGIGHPSFLARHSQEGKVVGYAKGTGTGEPQQRLRVEEAVRQIWGPFWKGAGGVLAGRSPSGRVPRGSRQSAGHARDSREQETTRA